ncbi:cytochrome c assembly protein [Solidesulfovibrio fructosivorans JJ]]|uniref:Cytochrome c assembly protein n=1 Tax=Solidesulfovibrio fructosivorans JJ] TaxID=596151 RepID=E1K1I9_SOLFR|nr:cytochrome c biogenesis protein CcsA [Solidesulfovibrio fructosivorans]EFL49544.1 cytochrome c assembly protein [Solidesulfovibrio fructosivorans JJ]]
MPALNVLFVLVLAAYFFGATLHLLGVVSGRRPLRRAGESLTVAGFALHTVDLVALLATEGGAALLLGEFYFSLLAWSLLLICLFLWWRLRLEMLGLLAAPLALFLFLSSQAVTAQRMPLPKALGGLFFGLHIGALFLAISLLAMACGAGLAYLYLERKIKTKEKLSGFSKALPALSTCDTVNRWAVAAGFPLYTIGLLSGFIWAKLTWNRIFSYDPKEIIAICVWLLFAFLFHQRLFIGWRGRKTAKLAIWISCLTLVSLLVINFFVPTHHSFARYIDGASNIPVRTQP